MKRVCAWCDAELECSPEDETIVHVTHGICAKCTALIESSEFTALGIRLEAWTNGPTLALKGEVDHENVGQLVEVLRETIGEESRSIVLDLSQVSYVDSAGIAAIYELLENVQGAKEVQMTGLTSNLWRIFQISGLTALAGVSITPQGENPSRDSSPSLPRTRRRGTVLPRTTLFAGRLDQLARIRNFAGKVAGEARLEPERIFDLQVAVSEASANAIEHGLPAGDLSISASCKDGWLTIVVSHPGYFQARSGQDPARSHRGMGMPLMLALTDEITVSHPPGAGTSVFLSLYLG